MDTRYLRTFSIGVMPSLITDLHNRIVEEEHSLPFISLFTPSGDSLFATFGIFRDVVDEQFEIWENINIDKGDYRWNWGRITLRSSEARPVSANFSFRTGDYYTGTRNDYISGVEWRPSKHLTLGTSYELRQIRFDNGSFDVKIASAKINIFFTPDMSLNNLIQYDNKSKTAGWNTRFRWTFKPGNDLFIVFNNTYLCDDWRFTRQITETAVKAALTIRF